MEKTWKPTSAGTLAIIAGIIGIVVGGITIGTVALGGLGGLPGFERVPWFLAWATIPWGVAQIIFGIIAIIGGNHARNRRSWGRALVGSILAIPLVPPLGILAVIFLALGKNEFS